MKPRLYRWPSLIDPTFHGRRRAYITQATLGAIALAAILLLEEGVLLEEVVGGAIIASIASSIFIVFVIPHSVAASTRRVIGGHAIGAAVGVLGSVVLALILPGDATAAAWQLVVAGSASVGAALLIMALFNAEHPPAAGTTLGLVIQGASAQRVEFILSAVAVLVIIRIILLRRMVNLL